LEKEMSPNISRSNPWKKVKVPQVINAAGKMTYLGGSAVSESVANAMAVGAQSSIEMKLLMEMAAKKVAELTRANGALIVASASAGIIQAVAGCIAGNNLKLIQKVPFVDTEQLEILIQKPHSIDYGVSVTQLIQIGGGRPVEVGSANRCDKDQIESAISVRTAAILFVVSHHVHAEYQAKLDEVIALGRKYKLPVIVDAAGETDLQFYIKLGANLVVYSGHKAIGGPTSGLIIGDATLVRDCAAQERGVGRALKVSKEAIAGLIVALEEYTSTTIEMKYKKYQKTLELIKDSVITTENARLSITWDETRPIPRLEVTFLKNAEEEVLKLVEHLQSSKPAIWTRNHKLGQGIVAIDPREITAEDSDHIAVALNKFLSRKSSISRRGKKSK
jgi:D-glucosaminate-6-phosphate ammonia-lyase